MELLLGAYVSVVTACNKSLVGLKGYVVHEAQTHHNDSVVLYDPQKKKFSRVSKCLLKLGDRYIWTLSRNVKGLKKVNRKLSVI